MPRAKLAPGGGATAATETAAMLMGAGGMIPYGVIGASEVPPAMMYGAAAPMLGGNAQQQTRHARRVYVGGITELHGTEQEITTFFEETLCSCLNDKDKPAENVSLIGRVYLHAERGFAFLELPSIQMTTACMQLDGLIWKGTPLKVSYWFCCWKNNVMMTLPLIMIMILTN